MSCPRVHTITGNEYCRIALGQMQWRGWSTYSDIVAIWSWLDTEQSMMNFTTEIIKVCTCLCVNHLSVVSIIHAYVTFMCVCAILGICTCANKVN